MIRALTRSSCLALAAISAAAAMPPPCRQPAWYPANVSVTCVGSAEVTPLRVGEGDPWNAPAAPGFRSGFNPALSVDDGDKTRYSAIYSALSDQRWADAKASILALDPQDPMRSVALSDLYVAKDSPRVELFDVLDLVNKAAWLPNADQLSRLAQKRGATILPTLPQVQKMVWLGSAPRRERRPRRRTRSRPCAPPKTATARR